MLDKIQEMEERRAKLQQGGGPKAIERQHQSGKLTARERVEKLLDTGTFRELDLWAMPRKTGFDIDERELPGDGVIAGYGEVNGRPLYLYSQDFTVMGGTMAATHARKVIKVMERALKMRVPCIHIIDSGGVRVQDFVSVNWRETYNTMFYLHTISSGVIPQIALMMGPCAAGATYSPALTDFVIMVDKTSHMYIASPALIKSVQFTDVTEEEIGGARMHAEVSGCCDLVAANDDDCLQKTRELLGFLPLNNTENPPMIENGDDPNRRDDDILDVVPTDVRKWYDIRKVIYKLVDNSYFFELKPDFARNMVTGLARLDGHSVGIVANNPMVLGGAIDLDAADKEARFIRFCDAFNIPLVFMVDTPAYLPGVEQERGGIIRHGSKVLHAIAESTVPKMTVYIRKGYGGGNPAMCTVDMGSDLAVAWPTAELGLMSAEGAVDIIYRKEIQAAENPKEVRERRIEEYKSTFGKFPYHAAAAQWVEDVIDPRETRSILIKTLRTLANKKEERPWKKHGNIPL